MLKIKRKKITKEQALKMIKSKREVKRKKIS